ncbi:SOS response-associated peptidase [Grimontia kaedaensis]|uniref:Abasic site processing protein n=1 Tax=Grimontia kaedaensis TaxID=2872157 RepID=A0ABY4X0U0_9GAMM|nr:SOS response-associated peptidase family protein [Grimontia kaedaensis]USH04879.1 SOS response-associated peptidase [Grimontia kaedaensis]
MCGRFNVTDDPYMHLLLDSLGVDLGRLPIRASNNIAPTDTVSIVVSNGEEMVLKNACWWLLMHQEDGCIRPLTKYASFNTRSDKLNVKGSAGFDAFRQTRCIIPVSGFVETQQGNAYAMEPVGSAIAFGGLFRRWIEETTGEEVLSCSIVTLPPHPKIEPYHAKSMPLILPLNPEVQRKWLDCPATNVGELEEMLSPQLPLPLSVTPIEKASVRNAIGESVHLAAD